MDLLTDGMNVQTTAQIYLENLIQQAKGAVIIKSINNVKNACDYFLDGPFKKNPILLTAAEVARFLKSQGKKPGTPSSISRNKLGYYIELRKRDYIETLPSAEREKLSMGFLTQEQKLTHAFLERPKELMSKDKKELVEALILSEQRIKILETWRNQHKNLLKEKQLVSLESAGKIALQDSEMGQTINNKRYTSKESMTLIQDLILTASIEFKKANVTLKVSKEGIYTENGNLVWNENALSFLSATLSFESVDELCASIEDFI